MRTISESLPREETFSHEALFYAGAGEFVDRTAPFIREGLEANESVLVVVNAERIEMLRSELGGGADGVRFADMAEVGQNPARIIQAWRDFVDEGAGAPRRRRGIGEPIWAARSAAELAECERHEALLNLAFAGSPAWRLACPYDTQALKPSVIEEAMRNHPVVVAGGVPRPSATFRGLAPIREPFDRPMPEPPTASVELSFGEEKLPAVRAFVAGAAADSGLGPTRTEDLVLAANEIATNSVRHGGGGGVLRMWDEDKALVCEIRDAGLIDRPLAGRQRPVPGQTSGFGLWLANQLCDLVQVRSSATGTVVRLHMRP
jgi:anti-sigma regulatory factor (Ser/Thr protein kinase)